MPRRMSRSKKEINRRVGKTGLRKADLFHQLLLSCSVNYVMGRICSTHGIDENCLCFLPSDNGIMYPLLLDTISCNTVSWNIFPEFVQRL